MPHPLNTLRELYNLSAEEIKQLTLLFEEQHISKGTTVQLTRQMINQSIYIKRGAVRMYFIENGKEHTTAFAFDDEHLPLKLQYPHIKANNGALFVMFIEDTDVIFIPYERVSQILSSVSAEEQVNALKFLNNSILQSWDTVQSHLSHLLYSNAEERYNWAITTYPRLLQSATTAQIASFLGLSRETVTRIRTGKYKRDK